jgi:hypothetical protein
LEFRKEDLVAVVQETVVDSDEESESDDSRLAWVIQSLSAAVVTAR